MSTTLLTFTRNSHRDLPEARIATVGCGKRSGQLKLFTVETQVKEELSSKLSIRQDY